MSALSGLPLHHVGIVQPTMEAALDQMALLELELHYRGFVPQWSAHCLFTKPLGRAPIEYIVPDGGPLARFNKGAGGLHHVAFETGSLDDVVATLRGRGMALLEAEHVKGAGAFWCNFLSPVLTRGLQVEFVELTSDAVDASGKPRD